LIKRIDTHTYTSTHAHDLHARTHARTHAFMCA